MIEPILLTLALVLLGVHFGVPLTYYVNAKWNWLKRPWDIDLDNNSPNFTVIVPTYNEAEIIEKKLGNLGKQDYPSEKLNIVLVDSSSNDGTVRKIEKWSEDNELDFELIEESKRLGKFHALKIALKKVSSSTDVVVFTDADSFWSPDALKNAAKYFADSEVGSVTASMKYTEHSLEEDYRDHFNEIRIAESKVHSTPIHNGPFLAVRNDILEEHGLPEYPGSDDSGFGSYIAFLGYRAIQVDDIIAKEPLKEKGFWRKVRRAQTILTSFSNVKKLAEKKGVYKSTEFEKVWKVEWWLNFVNPWILLAGTCLLGISSLLGGFFSALIILLIGLSALALKEYRIWIVQQSYLIAGCLRNWLKGKVVWEK